MAILGTGWCLGQGAETAWIDQCLLMGVSSYSHMTRLTTEYSNYKMVMIVTILDFYSP